MSANKFSGNGSPFRDVTRQLQGCQRIDFWFCHDISADVVVVFKVIFQSRLRGKLLLAAVLRTLWVQFNKVLILQSWNLKWNWADI